MTAPSRPPSVRARRGYGRALVVVATLLSGVPPAAGVATAATDEVRCQLRIHVIDAVPVGPAAMDVARQQVERIWEPNGVRFDWRAGPPAPAADHRGVVVAMLSGVRESLTRGDVAWWAGGTLGTVGFADPVRPLNVLRILLSPEDLVERARLQGRSASEWPQAYGRRIVGQALGRVLAHELGHYLLASRQHSPRGLMRASFSLSDLQSPDLRPFRLDAPHAALLATSWLGATACRADLAAARR